MADEPTQQMVVGDGRSHAKFDVSQFRARWQALPLVTTRKAVGVDQGKAGELVVEMIRYIEELALKAKSQADRAERFLTENRALREHQALDAGGPPTMAVEAVVGGQLWAEEQADRLVAEAKREADRILDDARLQAAAMISADEPKTTGHRPTDFANMTAYVASQLPVAEKRVTGLQRLKADLLAEANAREAEREAWGEVLPLARQQLAGQIVDVREAQVAS